MTNLELVLNMLAEATTTKTAKEKEPQDFEANKYIARQGIEARISRPVVTSRNAEDLLV